MKETDDKVKTQTDTDGDEKVEEVKREAPDPYMDIDECESDLKEWGEVPDVDEQGRVSGEMQVPKSAPKEGKARKARFKYGSHRSKPTSGEEASRDE